MRVTDPRIIVVGLVGVGLVVATVLCLSNCERKGPGNKQDLIGRTSSDVIARLGDPIGFKTSTHCEPTFLTEEEREQFLERTPLLVLYYDDIVVVINCKGRVNAVRPPGKDDRRIMDRMMGKGVPSETPTH
jgi:hypothetical protein